MASVASLRAELNCSICLSTYTDPVMLSCGHNFCRICIDRLLDIQDESGIYSCPECREMFEERPVLNITLRKIMEKFLFIQPTHAGDKHLEIHNKSPEGVLSDSSNNLEDSKCFVHKKSLVYYCNDDASYICADCSAEEHQGHLVETLEEASEKRKARLRSVHQKLNKRKQETEQLLQSLRKCKTKVQEKAYAETEKVNDLFLDTEKQLNEKERRILNVISQKKEKDSHKFFSLINEQEIKKDKLSRKMRHVKKISNEYLTISENQKLAVWTAKPCSRVETAERFKWYPQVLSNMTFASGKQYWDVESSISSIWSVGICYPSINRNGYASYIGFNNKSWCLERNMLGQFTARHDWKMTNLPEKISSERFRICLDYEAGQLSFYELCDPIKHLHTFRDNFTEPLHSAFCIWKGSIKIIGGGSNLLSAMASNDLRDELLCSICCSTYTDPVMLKCEHNFCQICIDHVLDKPDRSGVYSCPECRKRYRQRPELMKNIALHNILENFKSAQPTQTQTGIFCTYCVDSPVPAVKSCLHCETSPCDKHLKVHCKTSEHVLCDPSTNLDKRKCSVHKKILEYYCTEDSACICAYCLAEQHRGHQVETLDEASEKKKEKLGSVLQKLTKNRWEIKKKVHNLEQSRDITQQNTTASVMRVNAVFADIKRHLGKKKERILSEISKQKMDETLKVFTLMQIQEKKKDELCRKMRHIEELCNRTDPLSVLQDPDTGDLCDPEEEGGDEDTGGHYRSRHNVDDLDVDVISDRIQKLSDIITDIRSGIYVEDPGDILLDVNTANNYIHISDDLKTATLTEEEQNRPETAERFQDYSQVISIRGFTSGRHYWDVEVSRSGGWSVGMCYPSMARRGENSIIGENNKSWSLDCYGEKILVHHNGIRGVLPKELISYSYKFRICLDYEAGRLSFYELCDPIKHLHTFTAIFTEPLHAAMCMLDSSLRLLGAGRN
ncbi:E3 ubiquitin/ISG15 ligase TRIM25-like [Leptodactylus fuscus]